MHVECCFHSLIRRQMLGLKHLRPSFDPCVARCLKGDRCRSHLQLFQGGLWSITVIVNLNNFNDFSVHVFAFDFVDIQDAIVFHVASSWPPPPRASGASLNSLRSQCSTKPKGRTGEAASRTLARAIGPAAPSTTAATLAAGRRLLGLHVRHHGAGIRGFPSDD